MLIIILILRRVRKIAKIDYWHRRVCPSIRIEQLGSHWTDFHELLYLNIFFEICREDPSFIKIGQE
jgi:hypothetical protein